MSKTFVKLYVILSLLFPFAALMSPANAKDLQKGISEKTFKNPRLDSVLEQLQVEYEKSPHVAQTFSEKMNILIKEDRISIFIFSETEDADKIDRTALQAYGAEIIKQSGNVMKVKVPASRIRQIADNVAGISFMKLPDKPVADVYQSEGAGLTGASVYHSAGFTGADVKVAIIDLGFANLFSAYTGGDLPGNTVLIDCSGSSCVSTGFTSERERHGTAVAEIVHDMAPGALLYLIKIEDSLDLVDAKNFCIANGIRIINHSVSWFNINFTSGECYNSNPVCTANDAYAHNILWVNAAGNRAKSHYEAMFTDSDGDGWHNVSGNSETISLSAEAGDLVGLHLTWNAWPFTNQDYDLHLFDSSMNLVAKSDTSQTGVQPPAETIQTVAPHTDTYYVTIRKYSASSDHLLELYSSAHQLSPYVASSSITSPSDAEGVMAVGAIDYLNWITGSLESYSSQGPTNDGRIKPEICGPDGVSNYTLSNFFGTSASSPHVAGAAALILSAHPDYSLAELWNTLISSAIDVGTSGQDNLYGSGLLNLEPPLDTFPPIVNAFSVSPQSLLLANAFTVSYTVSDSGGSGLSRIELWRANDSGGVPGVWTEVQRTYLSGNGPSSGSFQDIPLSIGDYWYEVRVVDTAGNWVTQPNPPGQIKATVLSPDLTGSWILLTETCKNTAKGIKCTVKGKLNIQNTGNQTAKSSYVRFYLSDDTVFDEGDSFLRQAPTGKIYKGKSKNRTFRYSFPAGTAVTGKYIIAVIDADNRVPEADEANNHVPYGPLP